MRWDRNGRTMVKEYIRIRSWRKWERKARHVPPLKIGKGSKLCIYFHVCKEMHLSRGMYM